MTFAPCIKPWKPSLTNHWNSTEFHALASFFTSNNKWNQCPSNSDKSRTQVTQFNKICFLFFRLPELLTHEVASHLVEQLIQVAPDDLYDTILNSLTSHLFTMSLHPITNFVLQRLIACARTKEQVWMYCCVPAKWGLTPRAADPTDQPLSPLDRL